MQLHQSRHFFTSIYSFPQSVICHRGVGLHTWYTEPFIPLWVLCYSGKLMHCVVYYPYDFIPNVTAFNTKDYLALLAVTQILFWENRHQI